MSIIEMGEKIAKEIDNRIDGKVISALVYGTEIHGDPNHAKDCNMVIVLDKVGQAELVKVRSVIHEMMMDCANAPLVVEISEVSGMGDSVPCVFLDVLSSYQTVYGKSIFKGLSTINHEHLRAQIELKLRESLFNARMGIIRAMEDGISLDRELVIIKNLMKRGLHLYLILKKPWLTEDVEKWDAFLEEFPTDNIYLKDYFNKQIDSLDEDKKRNLASAIVESGLKPLLVKVDEMGPD